MAILNNKLRQTKQTKTKARTLWRSKSFNGQKAHSRMIINIVNTQLLKNVNSNLENIKGKKTHLTISFLNKANWESTDDARYIEFLTDDAELTDGVDEPDPASLMCDVCS